MRILIPNAYSWLNKGDAGILIGMVKALRKEMPQAEITALSSTPEIDRAAYKGHDIAVERNLLTIPPGHGKTAKILGSATGCAVAGWLHRLFGAKNATIQPYVDADLVVSCGGGFLNDDFGPAFLLQLYGIYFATLMGKPTVIYGQSIGPFRNRRYRALARAVLKRVGLITVREEVSAREVRAMGLDPIVTADPAFLLPAVNRAEAQRLLAAEGVPLNEPLVGVTVRYWPFPGHKDGGQRFERYLQTMAQTIDRLTERAVVVCMPQVIGPGKDDDRIVAERVCKKMKRGKGRVKLIAKDYAPEELKGMIGLMRLFVGTRMHSNLFAASMGVPVVAIGYNWKTEGIMDQVGQGGYVCDIDRLEAEALWSKIEGAWDRREEISRQLTEKVTGLKKRALLNARLTKDFWEGLSS